MSLPVSVCIVARDEEDNLPRCLASVGFAAEVLVVVDARSRDATEKIAREAGAEVFVRHYAGNVEEKRFVMAQAREPWVLLLDADEVPDARLSEAIRAVVRADGPATGYEASRLTWHLGRWIRHGDFFPDWQLRLFRRGAGRFEGVNPHGHVLVDGFVERLPGELHHYSYRDLADQVRRIQDFSEVQARALLHAGRRARVRDLALRPPARFLRAYLLKQGFRDGVPGLVIAAATAFHVFLKYATLWELQHASPRRDPA